MKNYNCRKCGACCAMYCSNVDGLDIICNPLFPRDIRRFQPEVRCALRRWRDGDETKLAMPAKRVSPDLLVCEHFQGELGVECRCGIYEDRPYNCRWFANESTNENCVLSRVVFGIMKSPRSFEGIKIEKKATYYERLKAQEPAWLEAEQRHNKKRQAELLRSVEGTNPYTRYVIQPHVKREVKESGSCCASSSKTLALRLLRAHQKRHVVVRWRRLKESELIRWLRVKAKIR